MPFIHILAAGCVRFLSVFIALTVSLQIGLARKSKDAILADSLYAQLYAQCLLDCDKSQGIDITCLLRSALAREFAMSESTLLRQLNLYKSRNNRF